MKDKKLIAAILIVAVAGIVWYGQAGRADNDSITVSGGTLNIYNGGADGGFVGGITTRDTFQAEDLTATDDATIGDNLTVTGTISTVENIEHGDGILASSTSNSTETMPISYLTDYSQLDYTPGDAAVTLTLPATSTMTSIIQTAGQCMEWRFRNLDGTSATTTTFAEGTGTTLKLSETTGADDAINGGNNALLKFCRESSTDVTVYLEEQVDD